MTISLVTYNGLRWLPGCIESVRAQDFDDFELLVLDNASTDDSIGWLREQVARDGRLSLIESATNLGFARAHNRHVFSARGEYVLLLNQDVELDPGFLGAAMRALESRPTIAAVQPRLRRLSDAGERTSILDSTGLVMHRDRRVTSRRQGEQESERDLVPGPVWGADGPAPCYRRAALLDARLPANAGGWEVLDEDFFMYKEDVDLAWRLRLLGWHSWYEPRALAWHARGAGGPAARTLLDVARTSRTIAPWIKELSWRNQRLMQLKNEQLGDLVRDWPSVLRRELLSLAFILAADRTRLAAVPSLARHLPSARAKRAFLRPAKRAPRRGQSNSGRP